ncbi:MAG: noncanonical pyrimidine nucleotidase, YjjG family [Chitinophagaceae bacterium]|nr:noncanonical pyrimidine nucleotidase, YjjG family [Chitinophagaceae bacterium]
MTYKYLFFDLDHTLWDFEANARLTLEEVYHELKLSSHGIDDFTRFYERYIYHNTRLWDRYRKGFIKRAELRKKRMWNTLLDFKIGNEKLAEEMDTFFLDKLPTRKLLFPDTLEVLEYLRGKGYAMHLITNGFESVQHTKLHYSGIKEFFPCVITSEASNSLKPHKEIFDFALQKTGASLKESIMLGDDIEADIKGAQNAGMDQVFVNHIGAVTPVKPTFTVNSLKELEHIF